MGFSWFFSGGRKALERRRTVVFCYLVRTSMRIAFGEFLLDLDRRELYRGDTELHLSPKAYQLLALLVQERSRAHSKDELKERIWPETFVLETNLASLAAEVRRALGERGRRSGLVRTVHGFGYAFAGEARDLAGSSAVSARPVGRLLADGGETELFPGEYVVGRDPAAWLFLDDSTVSRRHARIAVSRELVSVEDLGSKNGTYVRGRKVEGPTALADGDELRIGSVRLTFHSGSVMGSTATVPAAGRPTGAG
jgi:DNA-binding winged helix-turn-helix (wHTH) protein